MQQTTSTLSKGDSGVCN